MSWLGQLFVWWRDATPGTFVTTWYSGRKVGEDGFGNRYFQTKDGKRRWVIYAGTVEASRVPPEWHGWLHHTFDQAADAGAVEGAAVGSAARAESDRHQTGLSSRREPVGRGQASAGDGRLRGVAARLRRAEQLMQNSAVETLIGAVVIAIAVAFLVFAYSSTGAGPIAVMR